MNRKEKIKISAIISIPFFLAFLAGLFFSAFTDSLDSGFDDLFFKLRHSIKGKEKIAPDFSFFNITDSFDSQYNDAKDVRRAFARVPEVLNSGDARTILWDSFFISPGTEEGDRRLALSVSKRGNVYLPYDLKNYGANEESALKESLKEKVFFHPQRINKGDPVEVNINNIRYPFPELAMGAGGLGLGTRYFDADGISRRLPLFYASEQGYLSSFVFAGICHFFDVSLSDVIIEYGKHVMLPRARFHNSTKDIYIPIDNRGRLIINFPGPMGSSFDLYPLEGIVKAAENNSAALAEILKNNFVFVGDISSEGKDFSRGIFDTVYPNSFLLASAMNTILTGNYLEEQKLTVYLLLCLFALLFCFFGLWIQKYNSTRFLIFLMLFYMVSILVIIGINLLLFIVFHILPDTVVLLSAATGGSLILIGLKLSQGENKIPAASLHDIEALPDETIPRSKNMTEEDFTAILTSYGIVTQRQQETALLLLKGLTNKEIAAQLCITTHAVDARCRKIYPKMGVKNKYEMIKKIYGEK